MSDPSADELDTGAESPARPPSEEAQERQALLSIATLVGVLSGIYQFGQQFAPAGLLGVLLWLVLGLLLAAATIGAVRVVYRRRRWVRDWRTVTYVLVLAVAIGVLAGYALRSVLSSGRVGDSPTGVRTTVSEPPSPTGAPSSSACDGQKVTVAAPNPAGGTGTVAIEVHCPAVEPERDVLVVETGPLGEPPHPVYFKKEELPREAGHYSHHFDLSGTPTNSFRWFYVVRVSPAEYIAFGANPVRDGGVLRLPDGASVVSNRAYQRTGW